MNQINKWSS